MKLSMKMTDRDKRLLTAAAFLTVLAVMTMGLLRPLHVTVRSLEKQIEASELQSNEMRRKAEELEAMCVLVQKERKQLEALQAQLLAAMPSQKLDQLFTKRAMRCGLTVLSIQIMMPEEAADIPALDEAQGEPQNLNSQEGIYVTHAALTVSGSREDLETFLDEVSEQIRGVRVTEIDWEDQAMSMELEILTHPGIP